MERHRVLVKDVQRSLLEITSMLKETLHGAWVLSHGGERPKQNTAAYTTFLYIRGSDVANKCQSWHISKAETSAGASELAFRITHGFFLEREELIMSIMADFNILI